MDVTIGNFGLVKPLLVCDGQIRSPKDQNSPGACIDRIMGRKVLAPGESLTQVIRLDQGELSETLRLRPGINVFVNADVISNAVPTPEGFRARAGGFVRIFSKMFTRTPASLCATTIAARTRLRIFTRVVPVIRCSTSTC